MGPPTEQLIRDYLNRLSVAARDRLGPEDRRALVDRTRKLIERRADFAGRPRTIEVGKVLARLGDPVGLVEQEVRRLAAVRSGEPVPADDYAEPGGRGFLAWIFRREAARPPGPAERGSAEGVGESGPEITLLDSAGPTASELDSAPPEVPGQDSAPPAESELDSAPSAASELDSAPPAESELDSAPPATPAVPATGLAHDQSGGETPSRVWPAGPAGPAEPVTDDVRAPAPATGIVPPAAAQPATANGVHNGTSGKPGTMPLRPQWPSVVARDGGQDYSRDPQHTDSAPPVLNGRVVGSRTPDGVAAAAQESPAAAQESPAAAKSAPARADSSTSTWPLATPVTPALTGAARRLLTGVASWAKRRPLEAVAVALLGVGGAAYPPVFLLGAVVALGSRLWDYRDKWLGLVLPVLLTLIGLAIGIAAGGRSHGLHEGWLYLNISSRVAAVLGACYLAWRSVHGRRPPSVPPWNKPHRVS